MNNIYEIGYGDYEDSTYILLTNEKKYTQKEFDDLILKCSLIEYKIYKKTYFEYYNDMDEKHFDYVNEYNCSFETIYSNIVQRLINNYNFKKIEASIKFDTFNDSLNNPRYTDEVNIKPIQKAIKNYEKNLIRLKKLENFI